ncbi:SRPBCC family protein [Pseudonocardia humida]|uniref:SRPBCC family protein n=1 Tax=Pseudonocardia humida TaxID=2800819 RepID=A0ABT0ZSJ9_9PSEU|nr:SRPBCC family protein [Pseudonocardia humida]MCO1653693.1 SRPBCC family protein [Pseudonocardia humida]
MTRFSASTESDAIVAAPRRAIWRALADPDLLPRLTPLLRRIEADGDRWRWHMTGLEVLGVGISPVFTERMRFTPQSRIDYTHEPPPGVVEQAGAEGCYELSDVPGGTRLTIRLALHVDLPLPRLAAPAVRRVMEATMRLMGDRFAANLLDHLRRQEAASVDLPVSSSV